MTIRSLICALAFLGACGGDDTSDSSDATDDLTDDADDASVCHGLELSACRDTAGCVPDECAGCVCDVTYRGCLDEGEVPGMCPALGCPQSVCCSSELACEMNGAACASPGSPNGCGACISDPGDCTTDADCDAQGPSFICEPIACSCTGETACVQGCVDSSTCGEGTTCDTATARCVPLACGGATACPLNFTCAASECVRISCTQDTECDGYCVEGQCYDERGECRLPVP